MTSIYNLRTAMSAPASINCYPNRTPEEYAANVAAKFGGTMPSWPELAALENNAARARNGNATMANIETAKANGKQRRSVSVYTQNDRKEQMLALLPATSREVAARLGFSKSYATDLLSQLGDEGRVKFRRVGQHTTMWERVKGWAHVDN